MAQKPSFRHHPVPEWHLKSFGHGSDGRKVFYYDKEKSSYAEADVNKFWKKRYYSLPASGSFPNDALEVVLAQIESDAARASRAVVEQIGQARFTLSPEERATLAEYLASLHVRVPAARNALLAESNKYVVEETERQLADRDGWLADARRRGATGSDDELDVVRIDTLNAVRSGALDNQLTDSFSLAGLASTSALAKMFFGMPWQLVRRRALPMFIAGDHPVMHCLSAPSSAGDGPPPFIMVPLAPSALLVLQDGLPADLDGRIISGDDPTGERAALARRVLPIDEWWQADQAARCNLVSWQAAERWVWGATMADLRSIGDRLDPGVRDAPGHRTLTVTRVGAPDVGHPGGVTAR